MIVVIYFDDDGNAYGANDIIASSWARDVVMCAIQTYAASVVLAHHYHGEDLSDLTRSCTYTSRINQFNKALSFLDIALLDHFVIGEKNAVSFKENKFLE